MIRMGRRRRYRKGECDIEINEGEYELEEDKIVDDGFSEPVKGWW